MVIRTAISEDVLQLIALERQAGTAAHWSEIQYDALFTPDGPYRLALVAHEDSKPESLTGFVIALCLVDDWEIENVVTAVEHRRKGIASTLVRELLERAKSEAATSVVLEVRESNAAARTLYKGFGFVEDGRRRNYYRNPDEDALLLRFVLQGDDKTA